MSQHRSNPGLNGKLIVASEKLEKMLKLRDTDLTAIGISFSGTQSPTADPGFGSRDRPDRRPSRRTSPQGSERYSCGARNSVALSVATHAHRPQSKKKRTVLGWQLWPPAR
jgi:hypothetical protein